MEQLKVGGRLVAPVGSDSFQNMVTVERVSKTEYVQEEGPAFRFVPFLEGKAW